MIHYVEHFDELRAAKRQLKRRKKARGTEGTYDAWDEFYDWSRYSGAYEPLVTIEAIPEAGMTSGGKASFWASLLLVGVPVVPPGTYRFKADFREMQLLRDGEVVQPIFPGRSCEAVNQGVLNDIACYGTYQYLPQDFEPGHRYQLRLVMEGKPDAPVIVDLDPQLIQRIHDDFRLFLEESATDDTLIAEVDSAQ
jgi:hypothetical protein